MNEKAQNQSGQINTALIPQGVTGVLQRKCDCGNHTMAGGECDACRDQRDVLQRKTDNLDFNSSSETTAPPIVHEVLRSPGRALDATTRSQMESGFARDFSDVHAVSPQSVGLQPRGLSLDHSGDIYEQEADRIAMRVSEKAETTANAPSGSVTAPLFSNVRIHTDARAAESARAVGAQAYTVGQHIVFGAGRYAPDTSAGRQLLAHELTHVIQQRSLTNGAPLMRRRCGHDGKPANCGAGGLLARWRLVDPLTQAVTDAGLDQLIVDRGLRPNFGGVWATQVQTPPNLEKEGRDSGRADGLKVTVADPLRVEVVEIKSRATGFNGGCVLASREADGYVRVLREIAPQVAAISRGLEAQGGLRVEEGQLNPRQRRIARTAGIDFSDFRVLQAWRFYNSLQNRLGITFTTGFSRVEVDVNRDGTPGQDYTAGPPVLERCRSRSGRQGVRQNQLLFQVNGAGGVSYGCRTTQCQAEEEQRQTQSVARPEEEQRRDRETQPNETDVTTPILVGAGGTALTAAAIAAARRRAARIAAERLAAAAARREAERLAAQAAWRRAATAAAERRAAQAAARGAGRRVAGRAVGKALVYGEVAAIAFLLVTGRAEARPGPGQSAFEALYKSMASNGTPPSPEMRELIESDPLLRQLAEDAANTGNATPLQEEMTRRMLETVRNNPDEFTPEDLEILMQVSNATSSSSGGASPQTVEELRAALNRARAIQRGETVPQTTGPAGGVGAEGGGAGNAGSPGGQRAPGGGAGAGEGRESGRSGAPGGQGGGGAGAGSERETQERYPNLSAEARQRLSQAPEQARRLLAAMTAGSGRGPRVTDEAVQRFLQTVPANLTEREARQLIQQIRPAENESLDEILGRLQRAIERIRADATRETPPGAGGQPRDSGGAGNGEERRGAEDDRRESLSVGQPQGPEGQSVSREQFIDRMLEVITNYRGWDELAPSTMVYVPVGDESFTRAPVRGIVNAYVYIKSRMPNGQTLRATALLRLRVLSRTASRRGGRVIAEVVSATDVVAENRRTLPLFRVGQRINAQII